MDDPSSLNQGGYKARYTIVQALHIALRMALTFFNLDQHQENSYIYAYSPHDITRTLELSTEKQRVQFIIYFQIRFTYD
ncbi:hypothetical protein SFSGTM_06670 [Sulfuriferula nivalis]|uniref:Uncharacterized protein n=1 Tax=Sulfuriferula nivalis TaxID=2675298 RepID=A0A809RDW3_9PROT|nr:hypothetical protein SFSGTM_06670 [Sulfuriferula nivalis]